MKLPVVEGTIRRRILVNFRAEPDAIVRRLPPRFAPKLHAGHAIVGVCLIRLEGIRPRWVPRALGIHSENAAHRVAVTWTDDAGQPREGVFIWRRDTGSRINHWAGGRLFPGEHHLAAFDVEERPGAIDLRMRSRDGAVSVEVAGSVAPDLPPSSIFRSVEEASRFFEAGSVGYSVSRDAHRVDGLALRTLEWQVTPLALDLARSSFFDDVPAGSVEVDHALLMTDVAHEWRALPALCSSSRA